MRRFTLRERLRYQFDSTLTKGPIALIGWLALASVAVIVVITAVVVASGIAPENDGEKPGFAKIAWMSLMRTLDAGTMGGDQGSWPFLFAMLGVTLGGVFVVSTLIGVLTNGIDAKIEQLRKGRSIVCERDHTLILGWSPNIFSIISEIVAAHRHRPHSVIVVLADKDKVEMEDAIADKVPDTRTTRVVCRSGSPIDIDDLDIANPYDARSIIIVAPEGTDDPDTQVIKTILALTHHPERREHPYHIVAEIHDTRNMAVAALVGKGEAQLLLTVDLISRITVQTCRQSGLSVVYTELLDFEGEEVCFKEEPRLAGKTFGEAALRYEKSALMGLRRASGEQLLNPPRDTVIAKGDELIAVAEEPEAMVLGSAKPKIDDGVVVAPRKPDHPPERTLILGWNRRVPAMINELDNYVAQGSEVTVVADVTDAERVIEHECHELLHQKWRFQLGDTTDRLVLDRLGVPGYNHIITISYSDDLPPQQADSRTLVTLLHLRDMGEKLGHDFNIVSEMLDVRNRELAEVTRADDFIVSDNLVSLMLAQVSENEHLAEVFGELFRAEGAEIYLRPAGDYIESGAEVDFYTVVEAALRHGEIALGYRLKSEGDAGPMYGVHLNPKKSERRSFAKDDKIIVLARE